MKSNLWKCCLALSLLFVGGQVSGLWAVASCQTEGGSLCTTVGATQGCTWVGKPDGTCTCKKGTTGNVWDCGGALPNVANSGTAAALIAPKTDTFAGTLTSINGILVVGSKKFSIDAAVKVTLDGNSANANDLKPGDAVKVDFRVSPARSTTAGTATKIAAIRQKRSR